METYHKIQTLFKRHTEGKQKGKMIGGEWTTDELKYLSGNLWEFTEKVDGTNIRIGYNLGQGNLNRVEFGGRSDEAVIPKELLAHLNDTFTPGLFKDAELQDITLFGEGYGPKIQGGGKYRENASFVLFDVKIGNFWLDRHNVDDIANKLGIDSVPTIGHGTLYDGIELVASRGSSYQMKSQWGDFEAEGIVARPRVPLFNRKGERIITKIKAVDFK